MQVYKASVASLLSQSILLQHLLVSRGAERVEQNGEKTESCSDCVCPGLGSSCGAMFQAKTGTTR